MKHFARYTPFTSGIFREIDFFRHFQPLLKEQEQGHRKRARELKRERKFQEYRAAEQDRIRTSLKAQGLSNNVNDWPSTTGASQ